MEQLVQMVRNVGNAPGRNDKMTYLLRYGSNEDFKKIMHFIYNPYIRTGIAATKLNKGKHDSLLKCPVTIDTIVDYFMKHVTGTDADVHMAWGFINAQQTIEAKNLVKSIITKDLKIGITATTLNQVYGKTFIPKIGCMLGEKYTDYRGKVKGPYIATEKFDGVRRLLIKENGNILLCSRSGIIDDGCIEIEEEAKHLPDNFVYDGECLAKGEFPDSIALRQATNAIMALKGKKTGIDFKLFDMVPVVEFKAGKSKYAAIIRKTLLGAIFKDRSIQHLCLEFEEQIEQYGINYDFQHIKPAEILGIVETEEEIMALTIPIWKRKFEGTMLNTTTGFYEIKRTKELLKVKNRESYDLPIVDFIEGTGKYIGMLGAFVVEYKGNRLGVGSGLTDSERQTYWENKDKLVGKKIEIDTFGESKDKSGSVSLNCPIYKGIRYDK